MFLGKFTQHGYRSPNHLLQLTIAPEHIVRKKQTHAAEHCVEHGIEKISIRET